MERERERQKDLMKGYGHEEPAPIYIHYQCFAFPRVPWRKHLLAAHNLPPLPLFFHPFITVASQPRPPRITPQAGVFCQTASREGETQREGTDRGAKLGPGMGRGRLRGLVLGAPLAGVTLHPPCTRCLITSLLIYHVWTYSCSRGLDSKTNCWSGGFVKEMSVLSAEGLKLI